jgi:hypothetical protein
MLGLGLTFFVLSSEYRTAQLTEFYYLKKHLNVSYSEFLIMPIFLRKFILDKWIEDIEKNKG